jgi:hypothetical protein
MTRRDLDGQALDGLHWDRALAKRDWIKGLSLAAAHRGLIERLVSHDTCFRAV